MKKLVNGLAWIRFVHRPFARLIDIELFFYQLNCEELVEGYENPVAGVTRSADKEASDDEEDEDDEEISSDAGTTSSKKKKPKASPSTKSISILSRTTSEFDTCTPEKSVEFDPVQGKLAIPIFFSSMTGFIYYSLL